jgi:nitrogen fixation NifU-like protein
MSIKDELDELYQELILDHYRNPRNTEAISGAQIEAEQFNPFCGDQVILQISVNRDGTVQRIAHQGQGCSISQASASMLTELIKGKTLENAHALTDTIRRLLLGEQLDPVEMEALGEFEALQGVSKFPVRIKCALLAWTTLEEGIEGYMEPKE